MSGAFFCLASATAFGAMGVFGKLAYDEGATVGTLLATRFVLAATVLWLFALCTGRARDLRALSRRDVAIALALGAVGYGAQAGGYFAALERLDASLLSLLVYTFPVIVTVAAVALGRERASRRKAVALGLASTGLVLVLAGAAAGALDAVGTALGLGAAVVYSVYILVSEGVAARVGPLALSMLVCTGAATTLTLAALAGGDLEPAAVSAEGFAWLGSLAVDLDGRRHRPVLCRLAPRGTERRVHPLDARAGRHRRARVRGVRRVAGPGAARRRSARPGGGARRPRSDTEAPAPQLAAREGVDQSVPRLILLILLAVLVSAAPAQADPEVGIADDRILMAGGAPADRAVAEWGKLGVDTVRIFALWSRIAPASKPRGFQPADPADPNYQWFFLDQAVARVRAAGMSVTLTVTGPGPRWVSSEPRRRNPAWKPRPAAYAAFAEAVARRYGASVDRYILWNEPNISAWLSPQAKCSRGRCTPVSPHLYRSLARAGYPAIRRGDPGAQVVIGALSPRGQRLRASDTVMRPLLFLRRLGCRTDGWARMTTRLLPPLPAGDRRRVRDPPLQRAHGA